MGRTVSSDPNVIALPASPTGFTAGDYVYQTSSGYGSVPAGALSTGMFNVGPLATPAYASTASTVNELTYIDQTSGSMGSQVAAQLTNGNIVYTYGTPDTVTYGNPATVNFRIETTAGASVVAQTSTTMTIQGPFHASVVALPAGGFCIVASVPNASAFSLSARFYNADGTTATAVLTSGLSEAFGSQVSKLKLQALSDGSVIIGYSNTSNMFLRRVTTAGFDATFGTTGAYQFGTALNQNNWDFIVDGTNNIHIIYNTSTTTLTMRRVNSSGVQQSTSNVTGFTSLFSVAIVITSDGTIRGLANDSTGVATVTWNGTTAALGTRIISGAAGPFGAAFAAFPQGSSGGYVVLYNAAIATNAAVCLYYQAFNSSDASLASAVRVNSGSSITYRTQYTPIIVSGNTRIYFGLFQNNFNNLSVGTSTSTPAGLLYFAYSNTTYQLVGAPTVNYDWGSQGPYALGAYARAASTASSAGFTVAATGSYPFTIAGGGLVIPKTLIDGNNQALRVSLAPLSNGEFVAAWSRTGGTCPTYISKYSAAGVLQVGPVTVQATGTANSYQSTTVATFANGNILVTYTDATTTTLRFRIYTPSLTVVTSGTVTAGDLVINGPYCSSTSFGDGTYVAVMYPTTGTYQTVRCIKNDGTVTSPLGTALTSATNWFQAQIIGFKANAFAIGSYQAAGGGFKGTVIRQTGPSTFLGASAGEMTFGAAGSFSNGSGTYIVGSPIATPGNAAYMLGVASGDTTYRIISINPVTNTNNQLIGSSTAGSFAGLTINTNTAATITYTANGTPVLVANRRTTQFISLTTFTMPFEGVSTTTGAYDTTLATYASSNTFLTAIPHVGEAVIVGYIDSNGYPAFASVAATPFSFNATLTAGTDFSTSKLMLTPESGYSLQGISLTGASSGSTGLIKTRGMAQLNSNYSAATPATSFDFRNPITSGTYGTIVGRNVFMGN